MLKWNKTNKKQNTAQNNMVFKLKDSLEDNIALLGDIFKNDETLIFRRFENPYSSNLSCCIVFMEGMVNIEIVNENIIQPIITYKLQNSDNCSLTFLQHKLIISSNIQKTADVYKLLEAIMSGDTVLLLEGSEEVLIISSKGWQTRSVDEPENEKVLRGPREGFTESIILNT
ncbi:MAG TPA: spore germination protein, partial [Clostridia bacterium]|nr:spore germination protein [Clostridia bacterium]